MTATALLGAVVAAHAGLGGTLKCAPFPVAFTSDALVDESEITAGILPGHILVLGGWMAADDLDTGTEALEIDWGWAANGADQTDSYVDPSGNSWENTGYQASQTGFVDSGVLSGDAITDLLPAGKNLRFVVLPKPLYFKRETNVIMHVEVPANAQAAGNATLNLLYIVP